MKKIFIETLKKSTESSANKIAELIAHLNNNKIKSLALTYSVQYKKLAELLKKELQNNSIKVMKFIQVLGCSKVSLNDKSESNILIHIGAGRFHALNLVKSVNIKEILVFNEAGFAKITPKDIEEYNTKRKAKLLKYLSSNNIGVVVSLKPGQQNLASAINFKNKKHKEDSSEKKYLFLCNNINTGEFENFSDIECWINTACPRIEEDSKDIVNLEDIN